MILALGHRKYVGKDSVAKIIAKHFAEYNPKLISFALPLKQMTYDLFGFAGVQKPEYYETLPHEKMKTLPGLGNKSARDLWISAGNYMRQWNENVWARRAIDQAKIHPLSILTDCRYPNEVALLKAAGAMLIRIDRPQIKPTDDIADCALDGFTGWNHIFINSSVTLKGLEKKVRKELMPLIAKGL